MYMSGGLPRWHSGKDSTYQCWRLRRLEFNPWFRKIPWRRKWQPVLVFCFVFFFHSTVIVGEFHGQRSLASYNPQGHKRLRDDWVSEHTCLRTKWERLHNRLFGNIILITSSLNLQIQFTPDSAPEPGDLKTQIKSSDICFKKLRASWKLLFMTPPGSASVAPSSGLSAWECHRTAVSSKPPLCSLQGFACSRPSANVCWMN